MFLVFFLRNELIRAFQRGPQTDLCIQRGPKTVSTESTVVET
jgi:hypothetical protein